MSACSSLRGRFWLSMACISLMAVSNPSPVVAYLLKMMWPLSSPPIRSPRSRMRSYT